MWIVRRLIKSCVGRSYPTNEESHEPNTKTGQYWFPETFTGIWNGYTIQSFVEYQLCPYHKKNYPYESLILSMDGNSVWSVLVVLVSNSMICPKVYPSLLSFIML